jgi:DNA-directed RNA polymerase subunit RPC12/RpoP
MFQCSKCRKRLLVVDGVDTSSDEKYRKLKCPECGEFTYTVEMIIDPNDPTFKREWFLNHRSYKRYYEKIKKEK